MFTLHHWADELLNAANGQGGGGPRDPTAKCIPSQGQLVDWTGAAGGSQSRRRTLQAQTMSCSEVESDS